jgi:hypothetical protein
MPWNTPSSRRCKRLTQTNRFAELRTQSETLQEEFAEKSIVARTTNEIAGVLTVIGEATGNGTHSQRKALMQQLVAEIRVESRSAIFPTYRLRRRRFAWDPSVPATQHLRSTPDGILARGQV